MSAPLTCPVRACHEPLVVDATRATCGKGHAFDRARSGYLNLLQPQDKRSKQPGDSKETSLARRRTFDRGVLDPLVAGLAALLAELGMEGRPALDVGCGEGSVFAELAKRASLDGLGVDLSSEAIDMAAKRFAGLEFVVANADRALPVQSGSFPVVTSITSRKNAPELRRVLAEGGALIVVVSAADDLCELREVAQGRADDRDRKEATRETLAPSLTFDRAIEIRSRPELPRDAILDLLASTYRGARHRERERLAQVDSMAVTLSYDAMVFR